MGGGILVHGDSGMPEFATKHTRKDGAVVACDYNLKGNRVKVSFPWLDGGDVGFGYDAFGGLVSVTNAADADGQRRVDSFVRSNGFVVVHEVDSGAGGLHLVTACFRDAAGNVTSITDPNGNESLFTYNAMNQCVRAETPTNISARCKTDFFMTRTTTCCRSSRTFAAK